MIKFKPINKIIAWALSLKNTLWIEKIFPVLTPVIIWIFTTIVEFCRVFEIFFDLLAREESIFSFLKITLRHILNYEVLALLYP